MYLIQYTEYSTVVYMVNTVVAIVRGVGIRDDYRNKYMKGAQFVSQEVLVFSILLS